MKPSAISKAYEILEDYQGPNPHIRAMSYTYMNRGKVLTDFEVDYINANHDYQPQEVNRLFHITPELGEKLATKHHLPFIPEKIVITKVIGTVKGSYHAYFKYRQSEGPILGFLSSRGIMGKVLVVDWKSLNVDFSRTETLSAQHGDKVTLREYQKDGVRFLIGNQKCICADEQGLGKSLTAINAALLAGCRHTLIISPASLKTNWKRECLHYANPDNIEILNGSKWSAEGKLFTIMNYEIIQNFYEVAYEPVFEEIPIKDDKGKVIDVMRHPVMVKNSAGEKVQKMKKSRKASDIRKALENSPLFQNEYDCVIIDEAQKLSNNTSRRYKTIQDFLRKAAPKYIFLLTGTPLTNNPMNLYHILNLVDADVVKNYKYYTQRFCGAMEHTRKDGRKYVTFGEVGNLTELREKIKDVYIRRLASETGEMVKKSVQRTYYDLTPEENARYKRLWEDYMKSQEGHQVELGELYSQYGFEIPEGGGEDSEKYRQLIEGGLIRQYLGLCMVSRTIELADSYLEDGEKVVVMTSYRKEMELIKEHYGDRAVCYNGSMTIKQKDAAQKAFNEDPKTTVFIGNIQAASVGLNLPASHILIFNNFDWVYAQNAQAESRIHRLTQTEDVTCIYQLFSNTMAQEMFDKVLYKQYLSEELIKSENSKQ